MSDGGFGKRTNRHGGSTDGFDRDRKEAKSTWGKLVEAAQVFDNQNISGK